MKKEIQLFTMALFLAGASFGQGLSPFESYDADRNGSLDRDEYGTAWERERAFSYWDSDEDGLIESEEYTSGVRERYDYDRDDYISRDEWNRPTPWSKDLGNYEDYDTNGDERIDKAEWDKGAGNFSYEKSYDTDGDNSLNEREYTDMTYDSSDMDKDGNLSDKEFTDTDVYRRNHRPE